MPWHVMFSDGRSIKPFEQKLPSVCHLFFFPYIYDIWINYDHDFSLLIIFLFLFLQGFLNPLPAILPGCSITCAHSSLISSCSVEEAWQSSLYSIHNILIHNQNSHWQQRVHSLVHSFLYPFLNKSLTSSLKWVCDKFAIKKYPFLKFNCARRFVKIQICVYIFGISLLI